MKAGSHLYLIRLGEAGREAQPKRSGLRRDVIGVLEESIPGGRTWSDVGRIFLEAPGDACAVLRGVHGIASFSPCVRCALAELEDRVAEHAARCLSRAQSYRVKVRRLGVHPFTSMEMAARLGARIHARLPGLRVDMTSPDATLWVEIRGEDCYVFDAIVPGVDRRDSPRAQLGDPPTFLVDQMLGRLVTWLRVLGFDAEYVRDLPDSALLRRASAERRIVLTRDRELSRTRAVRVILLEGAAPEEQLAEVVDALELRVRRSAMFTRCTLCNRPVQPVDKESVEDRLPQVAYQLYDEFTSCDACGKLYWKGGQYDRILARLAAALEE